MVAESPLVTDQLMSGRMIRLTREILDEARREGCQVEVTGERIVITLPERLNDYAIRKLSGIPTRSELRVHAHRNDHLVRRLSADRR